MRPSKKKIVKKSDWKYLEVDRVESWGQSILDWRKVEGAYFSEHLPRRAVETKKLSERTRERLNHKKDRIIERRTKTVDYRRKPTKTMHKRPRSNYRPYKRDKRLDVLIEIFRVSLLKRVGSQLELNNRMEFWNTEII